MKIVNFTSSYVSKNGNPVFVHSFSATKEELENLTLNGAIFRLDDKGNPICFLNKRYDSGLTVALSQKGRLYVQEELLTKAVQSKADTIKAFMAAGISLDKIAVLAFGSGIQE